MIGSVQFEFQGQPVHVDLDDSLCWRTRSNATVSSEAMALFQRIAPARQVERDSANLATLTSDATAEAASETPSETTSQRPAIGGVVVVGRHMLYQAASRVSGHVELHRDRQATH